MHFHLGYHIFDQHCVGEVAHGEKCSEEITCRLKNKKFRCSTTMTDITPRCVCKEGYGWRGGDCVKGAPGGAADAGRQREKQTSEMYQKNNNPGIPEEEVTSTYDWTVTVAEYAGPVALVVMMVVIFGCCIGFSNIRYIYMIPIIDVPHVVTVLKLFYNIRTDNEHAQEQQQELGEMKEVIDNEHLENGLRVK